MKISVITPVFNGEEMIESCVESVLGQDYNSKEHVIIDGGSKDNTVEIIKKHAVKWISEKDKGLYDAINKGIRMSTGDVICILGSDDMYAHSNVYRQVASVFEANPGIDIIYGDMIFVDRNDTSKIVRYWKSSQFEPGLFRKGWLPQNHTLFIRRNIFEKYGSFDLRFEISDYELQYRFFEKLKLNTLYIPGIIVKMRSGGVSNSSIRNIYINMKGIYKILKFYKVNGALIYIVNTLLYRYRQVFIPPDIKHTYTSGIE